MQRRQNLANRDGQIQLEVHERGILEGGLEPRGPSTGISYKGKSIDGSQGRETFAAWLKV
jgi:hypothetical protein